MLLEDRQRCVACKIPMSSNQEPKVEGTRVHQAFGHCCNCYQKKLRDGSFTARSRNQYTETHILCYSCNNWKEYSKFKRSPNTLVGREYKCASCTKLWERYRLHYSTFVAMITEQGGGCAICLDPFENIEKSNIDHDHSCCQTTKSCGKCVRGILCLRCNSGLGFFKDNIDTLERAKQYLESSTNEKIYPRS